MVVDDNDVALGGATAHFRDEAAVELLALRADAAVGASIQLRPELAALGKIGEFGAVARLRRLVPIADDAKLVDLFQPAQDRLIGEVVELLTAKVVCMALHVAHPQFAQVCLQKR